MSELPMGVRSGFTKKDLPVSSLEDEDPSHQHAGNQVEGEGLGSQHPISINLFSTPIVSSIA